MNRDEQGAAWLGWVLLAGGLVALAVVFAQVTSPALAAPPTAAVDLLPLWLGAEALRRGLDPNDPTIAAAIFAEEGLRLHPGGFYSYYPPSASLLLLPARWFSLPFESLFPAVHWVQAVAMAGGACLASAASLRAGAPDLHRDGPRGWASPRAVAGLALGMAALWLATRPARIVIPSGQPGPLVLVATCAALAALAARRPVGLGLAVAGGIGLKVFPVVVVPVLVVGRRWTALAVVLAGLVALTLCLVALRVPLEVVKWAGELLRFVDKPVLDPWLRHEPAWLLLLWRGRIVVPALATGLCLLWAGLRGRDSATIDLAFLAVATGGLAMCGSHHYHEALVILPALAHALLWPAAAPRSRMAWAGALAVAAALVVGRGTSRFVPPDSLHWVGMGAVVYGVLLTRSLRSTYAAASTPAPPVKPAA